MDELDLRQLTWFPVDSRASHLAWLENNEDTMTTDTYGRKCLESSDPLDHVGFSVKTYLESCELPGKTFAKVWSISDILSPFLVLKLRLSAQDTDEKGSSLWPTPLARDYNGARTPEQLTAVGRSSSNSLPDAVRAIQEGALNPDWIERLMGFPLNWTVIEE